MLSNLNTNMKVLIGISSVAIIGIIYSLIKSFFTSNKKKMVEGLNDNGGNGNGNVNGNGGNGNGNGGNDYRELIKSINSLNKHMENLNKNFINFKKMTYDHYKLHRTKEYNILFNNHVYYTTIHINNNNSECSTDGVLTINNPETLGFSGGLNVLSIYLKQATISGAKTVTKYISMFDDGTLQKHLSPDNKLATIPISSSLDNTIYQRNMLHHSHSPINIYTLDLSFKKDDDTPYQLPGNYSFDIEIMHLDTIEAYDYLHDIYGLNLLSEPGKLPLTMEKISSGEDNVNTLLDMLSESN